ncbi:5-hydroxytryptamine receptor 7-like [Amphiura filiformis]|uniref:5-hydroxytryptamine receptor 7-like n=1 Tax=Amphiura filiformis TaxID=82378 RepID=UPI003B211B9F
MDSTTITTVVTETGTITLDSFEVNIFYAILLPLLILVAVAMNLITIAAFWKMPILREEPSELLILNLACSDLLTGITVLPLVSPLYITPGNWPIGQFGCGTVVFFMNLSTSGSLFALTTISIDRFLLVYMEYPRYMKTMTRNRVYKTVFVGWAFALITVVVELSVWEKAKTIDITARNIDFEKVCLSPARRVQAFALAFFLMLFVFPVVLVCGLSIAFLYQLRLRLQKIRRTHSTVGLPSDNPSRPAESNSAGPSVSIAIKMPEESVGSQSTSRNSNNGELDVKNRYLKPGITLVGVVLAMAICMLPFCFYVIITESGCEQCNKTDVLYGLLLMQFSNACIDPLIYVLTRRKVRKFYISVLTKCTANSNFVPRF